MRQNTPEEMALLTEIAIALKEAQRAEATRDINRPFSFERNGEGWQIKVHDGNHVRVHFWANTAKLIKRMTEGTTPAEFFANNFKEVRMPQR